MFTNHCVLLFIVIFLSTKIYCAVNYDDIRKLDQFSRRRRDLEVLYTRYESKNINEDLFLNGTQLLRKYGCRVEEHIAITKDGYILTMIRIPGPGPVVLLMHGLLSSSDDFITAGPDNGLAYLLVKAGYDVWLANARGNKYSRRHLYMSPEGHPFWNFSWHEIGYYDLPVLIDYALTKSKQTQLTYIGHSQGTTAFYVLTSMRPEYNKKIRLCVSLATVAWIGHIKSPDINALIPLRNNVYKLLNTFRMNELFPSESFLSFITTRICPTSTFTSLVCISGLFTLFGFDYDQIDYDNLAVKLSHIPSGSALKQHYHYSQLVASRRFAMFDYGPEENLRTYGMLIPPSYPVENVTAPVLIFYAENDLVSTFEDVRILIAKLSNVVGVYKVPHPQFNHFDYLWAKDVKQLLYYKMMNIIGQYA